MRQAFSLRKECAVDDPRLLASSMNQAFRLDGKMHGFASEAHDGSALFLGDVQGHFLSAKENFRSRRPHFRLRGPARMPEKLLLQPSEIAICKPPSFPVRTPPRMPRKAQANMPSADLQPLILGPRDAFPVKQKLKLHAPSLKRRATKTIPHCRVWNLRNGY